MRGTQKALMARGLDSDFAAKLANDKWTIGKLKQTDRATLKGLGLNDDFVSNLFKEARPPIPNDTLMSVLFANRYQCCVCRDPSKSFIVHHIEDWAKSRSHDIEKLAVLCLHHHDEAHSKKTLSDNLDAKTLQAAKTKWEAEVKRFDAESILAAMRLDYSNWNFINELRVFELAKAMKIEFDTIHGFAQGVASGVALPDGLPVPVRDDSLFYMYEGPDILARYFYVSEIFREVIHRLDIINISDFLDKGVLNFSLVPGDFIFVQGAHTFSPITQKKSGTGRGQICDGIRRANNVEVRFTFDRWEATSSSAKNGWLVGTRDQGSLVHVKDISRSGSRLVIRGTVLGICSNFGDLKTRDYAQSLRGHVKPRSIEYDDEDDNWLEEQ